MSSSVVLLTDRVPLGVLYGIVVAVLLLADEVGFRFGRYRQRFSGERDTKSQAGGIMASVFALLAFMLAFTFSMAASRYADRKELVVTEANAIGTAYLRADLVPDPERTRARDLLREYVDLRLEAGRMTAVEQLRAPLARSTAIHDLLWDQAAAVGRKLPDSVAAGLFVASINDVIDLHNRRVTVAVRNRIPPSIWWTLHFLASVAMGIMGYSAGLTRVRSTIATIALVLTFSAVFLLIVDLDRPAHSLFSVSQQAMIDLHDSLQPKSP